MAIVNEVLHKRVFIERDNGTGFDGVVTEAEAPFIFVEVTDTHSDGFVGIWVNTNLIKEIAILK